MDVDALTAHLPAAPYKGAWGSDASISDASALDAPTPAPAYGAGRPQHHASFPPPNYTELCDTSFHFRYLQSLNERANELPGGGIEATLKRVRSVLVWLASVAHVRGLFHLRYRVRQGQRLQRVLREHLLWRDQALWRAVCAWGAAEDKFRRNSGIGSHGQGLEPLPDAGAVGKGAQCTCTVMQVCLGDGPRSCSGCHALRPGVVEGL